METYEVDPSAPTHGSSGPLKVSYGGFFSETGKQLLDIGPKYDKRRASGKDANAFDASSVNIFTVSQLLASAIVVLTHSNLAMGEVSPNISHPVFISARGLMRRLCEGGADLMENGQTYR